LANATLVSPTVAQYSEKLLHNTTTGQASLSAETTIGGTSTCENDWEFFRYLEIFAKPWSIKRYCAHSHVVMEIINKTTIVDIFQEMDN
jgi:hypothetical protein